MRKVLSARENLVWGLLAGAAWTLQTIRLHDPSVAFPFLFFLKGLVLTAAAAAAYQLSAPKKIFSFLGMFPLLWLALSRFQWSLCADQDFHYWLWLVLFLFSEMAILSIHDGRKLLLALAPLWTGLAWLSPVSLLLPLGFIFAPSNRFKNVPWTKWGGLLAGFVLIAGLRGWQTLGFDWISLFDFLASSRYAAFFMLGWLGLISFPRKGTFRYALTPMFALALGFIFWPTAVWDPQRLELLKWVLVFSAGFGWESFRRDLMDPTWHGRAVWFALGLALFWGMV